MKAVNELWLGPRCFLVKAQHLPARLNQRPGVTVLVARGADLLVEIEGQKTRPRRAHLLAPEVKRRFSHPQPHFSLTLEPGHRLYGSYLKWAREGGAFEHGSEVLERVERVRVLEAWLVAALKAHRRPIAALDARLVELLALIEDAGDTTPRAERIWQQFRASHSGSQSQWSRWLQAQVGLSLRKLLLGRKLREAMNHIGSGSDATTIAHEVGFADSSHLSRLSARTFGVGPRLARDRKILQVSRLRDL